ncbi:TOBE domain-containing protein [Mesorhizobium sp. ZC-5]|uniref:TOBE domain-containing protein n=1 Tax=Mesorhizobium sp. ZC-5 TaxID=2986066 RepID=UPI0039962A91
MPPSRELWFSLACVCRTQSPGSWPASIDHRRSGAGNFVARSVMIRPEDLVHDDTDTAMLRGTVRTIEYLGSRNLVRVDVGDFPGFRLSHPFG